MAKRSRTKARDQVTAEGAVGPREPCPCGSGKRYKACHGSAGGAFVVRPFEGLAWEPDLVWLREFVAAATAPLTVGDRTVRLSTLLPIAAPAMVRDSGEVWLGLQVRHSFGDPSRDLAAVLEKALAATAPGIVGLVDPPGPGPRFQDLVGDEPLEITVHDGFGFWLDDVAERDEAMVAALEEADASAAPAARLSSVEAAYWTDAGSKEHLRWVRREPEAALLNALARLVAAGEASIAEGSKVVGMFRAHGLLVPVWDLPPGTGPQAIEEAVVQLEERLQTALAATAALTAEERATRSELANKQVTLR
jgi:hypothetical protein